MCNKCVIISAKIFIQQMALKHINIENIESKDFESNFSQSSNRFNHSMFCSQNAIQ